VLSCDRFASWFAGAAKVTEEGPAMGVYSCNTAVGSDPHQVNTTFGSLSPLGLIAQTVLKIARTEERGTPMTPVVAVIDLQLGYNTGTDQSGATKWGVLPMSEHDRALDYLLHRQLFVESGLPDEELKITPHGDIIDVALSDSEPDYLSLYPVILLVGEHNFSAASGLPTRLLAALRSSAPGQSKRITQELMCQQYHVDAIAAEMGSEFVRQLNSTGKLRVIAPQAVGTQPAASIAVDDAELQRIGRDYLPVVVSATTIRQAASLQAPASVLWQVNAQSDGGFVIELSNEWGVAKQPCGHQTLQPAGTATVTLELRQPMPSAIVREWISDQQIYSGKLEVGATLNITVAPGNTSFVQFKKAK
jgi:hypothetical protein